MSAKGYITHDKSIVVLDKVGQQSQQQHQLLVLPKVGFSPTKGRLLILTRVGFKYYQRSAVVPTKSWFLVLPKVSCQSYQRSVASPTKGQLLVLKVGCQSIRGRLLVLPEVSCQSYLRSAASLTRGQLSVLSEVGYQSYPKKPVVKKTQKLILPEKFVCTS